MRRLLKKYYKMNDSEKSDIRKLCILHELEEQLANYKDIGLDVADEEILFEETKAILPYSNIKDSEIISRLLELLKCKDITIDDIIGTETEELIKLITKHEGDFKETEYEIIKEFSCGLYYCVFIKQGEKFVLVFEKDNISHVEIFNSFEEILCYVIKNKLLSEGESIV